METSIVAANSQQQSHVMTPVNQASSDEHLIELWIHGRSIHTERAYRRDVKSFRAFVGKGLRMVTLGDVQDFTDSLSGAPTSQARTIAAVKSLLAFGHKLGYLHFDVGAAVQAPKIKDTLAERILPEEEVIRMLAHEPNKRNHALLRLLYLSGVRVSEVCGLCWKDTQSRSDGQGQITVYGKGGKTRAIMLPPSMWTELLALRAGAGPEDPVFRSRQGGGPLDTSMVFYIVQAAAARKGTGIEGKVSPHWLRHAHASHSMDHGAPIHLVQATLGHSSPATTGRYLHVRPSDSSSRFLVG